MWICTDIFNSYDCYWHVLLRRYAQFTVIWICVFQFLYPAILTVRAWAVWNQDRRLTIILPIAYALFWIPDFAFLAIFLRSLECKYRLRVLTYFPFLCWPCSSSVTDLPYPFVGCFVTHAGHILIMCWVVVLIWDASAYQLPSITVNNI